MCLEILATSSMPCVQSIWPSTFWLAVGQIGEQQTFAHKYKTKTRAKFVYRLKPGGSDKEECLQL